MKTVVYSAPKQYSKYLGTPIIPLIVTLTGPSLRARFRPQYSNYLGSKACSLVGPLLGQHPPVPRDVSRAWRGLGTSEFKETFPETPKS